MKKIFSVFICLSLIFISFALVGCTNNHYEPPHNIVQNLPDKIHVEYDTYGVVFVKDGNEYFCQAANVHGSHRSPMYMKRELQNEVCVADGYGGWRFITAIEGVDSWVIADNWNENDKNQTTYTNAEYKTRTGYIDVNTDTDVMKNVTITQLDNQSLDISGNTVECVVWDYVYENGNVYGHNRYWYAVDTGVFIKEMYTSDKNEDIETDGSIESIATYYAVGETMAAVLQSKGLTAPNLSAYV